MAIYDRTRKSIRSLILLTILAIAWTGKALDLHTPEFYRAQRIETIATADGQPEAREQLCGYCPICHFHFYSFEPAEEPALPAPPKIFLETLPPFALHPTPEIVPERSTPRAPPATDRLA